MLANPYAEAQTRWTMSHLPRSAVTSRRVWVLGLLSAGCAIAAEPQSTNSFLADPRQDLERTCFQTGQGYSPAIDLRSDVAIVYGIDPRLPERLLSWKNRGYRTHVMTGVSWGQYQDYLYGRFDGVNHEDEAQTDRAGQKISHGGDVYYMCPGENYGKFLCVGVQRALDAGAEAIHLEEPEFWVRGGYSEGFKREWQKFYGEPWQPPHASADAQWRASKLKYFLYRRALQQVFDFVQADNKKTGRHVRCYVPTHSLLNYAHWRIVSPESSLAQLHGCDGYIAQVWTGTSRTPNLYRGQLRERTFETAFLEYGAMQNLVRATGRGVWYLNDPVEDDPNHDWEDYRRNWESTLVASLLQPDVWQYEVMPWPERIFRGRFPSAEDRSQRVPIPSAYATEIQTVIHALEQMDQKPVRWENSAPRVGILVSDSLMFERGEPSPSDAHLSHFYGLALPLVKRGIPVEPVQLENAALPGYLSRYDVLLASYVGQKPLSADVHEPLASWVNTGGTLLFLDDDSDPFLRVREWWNTGAYGYRTPREHLFDRLGLPANATAGRHSVGRGSLFFAGLNPAQLATDPRGDGRLLDLLQQALPPSLQLPAHNYFLLRRGMFAIIAGLDESVNAAPKDLEGQWIDLFDPELKLQTQVRLTPGARHFLLDVTTTPADTPQVLAAACKILVNSTTAQKLTLQVEGIDHTTAIVLLRSPQKPRRVTLDHQPLDILRYDSQAQLTWLQFANQAYRRELLVDFH